MSTFKLIKCKYNSYKVLHTALHLASPTEKHAQNQSKVQQKAKLASVTELLTVCLPTGIICRCKKVNDTDTRTMCQICSNLEINKLERHP